MHRISDIAAPERPVSRLASRGPAGLSGSELLSIVTGRPPAQFDALIAERGSLLEVARMSSTELREHMSDGQANKVEAAIELGRRVLTDGPGTRQRIRAPGDLADRLILSMGHLEREELRVILLNTRNDVLRIETIYQGNVTSSIVRVGEIFAPAVRHNAASIILVHNHPSGDPTPSPDDLHLTAEVLAAGRILDINLLDHIVVASGGYVSLRDRGVSFDRPRT